MTYPNTPGFQSHSDTSREAAESIDAKTLRDSVLVLIAANHKNGQTADEVGAALSVPNSTIAARFRELEMAGLVIKTQMTRQTRAKRNAHVYVALEYYDMFMGRAAVKQSAMTATEALARDLIALVERGCYTDSHGVNLERSRQFYQLKQHLLATGVQLATSRRINRHD